MRRTLVVLLGLLAVPVVSAAPAYAVDHVICVNVSAGVTCDQTAATIPAAITAANGNGVGDVIVVGPGTYTDGPYNVVGTPAQPLTLQGSGAASTTLTLAANAGSQTYVSVQSATVRDLTVSMVATGSDNDRGISVLDSVLTDVTVTGQASIANAIGVISGGSSLSSGLHVVLPVAQSNTGVASQGPDSLVDSDITARIGYKHTGGGTSSVSRVRITSGGGFGVNLGTDGGTIDVDDSVIDLADSTGNGLQAENTNSSAVPMTINADHLTIVGGGPGSRGVYASASSPGAQQTASMVLRDSIVRGPSTDLFAGAGNNGAQAGDSTAVITTSYSDWSSKQEVSASAGSAAVSVGPGHLDIDPQFVSPAAGDYHLRVGSPVVDRGDPTTLGPATDRDGQARVRDGDGNGAAVRDMGAYERPTAVDQTAPRTTITKHPGKVVTKPKVKITFTSSEAASTFQCKLDKKPWRSCTSPKRFTVAFGKHKVRVRAIDKAGNVDATPARYTFRRVKPSPGCTGEC